MCVCVCVCVCEKKGTEMILLLRGNFFVQINVLFFYI